MNETAYPPATRRPVAQHGVMPSDEGPYEITWTGRYEWSGTYSGVTATLVTADDELEFFVKPVHNEYLFGVELVDADGRSYAAQYRAIPGAYPRAWEDLQP